MRALAKDPPERFTDLDEMRTAVRHLRAGVDPRLAVETIVAPSRDVPKPSTAPSSSSDRRGMSERRVRQIAVHREAARAALARGDLDVASAACDDALALDPDDTESNRLLTEIRRAKRDQESKVRRERESTTRRQRADSGVSTGRVVTHVGIDLGTTYSLIARIDHGGRAVLIPDHGNRELVHTPSIVCVSGQAAFVGHIVDALLEQDPNLPVVRFFKRHLGETHPVIYDAQGNGWMPEAIAALVLKKLKFDAESVTSIAVTQAAITVPAHFNDVQRKAVQAAALLADVPLLGLVEEPVAAALHYGITHASHDRVILVFDWGGGTFDATVLSLDARGVYVLAKTGLTDLGGKELDEAVGARVLTQFERATGHEPQLSARALLELRRISEQLKIELCMPGVDQVRQLVLLSGEAVDVTMRRDDFLADIVPWIERAERCALDCVDQAGLTPADVHTVLLVGGSSMVPVVEERLRRLFSAPGQEVRYHEPTKAVAFGAALRATQLTGDAEKFAVPPEFRGVTGYSVGVRAIDPQTGRVTIDTLIKQNMALPAKASKTYYSTRPNQERIVLELVQFRTGEERDAVSLGQVVAGLPSPKQNYPIEVTVENREDGTVRVRAWDAQTGVDLQQTFERAGTDGFAHLATQRALVRSTIINNV